MITLWIGFVLFQYRNWLDSVSDEGEYYTAYELENFVVDVILIGVLIGGCIAFFLSLPILVK